jgi:hypothetical protein
MIPLRALPADFGNKPVFEFFDSVAFRPFLSLP